MHLNDIHAFRGISILIIVFGHSLYSAIDWTEKAFQFKSINILFAGGSILFVFVSGYLFYYLLNKYSYSGYLKKKLKFIILPYIVVATPGIAHAFLDGNPGLEYPQISGLSTPAQVAWYYLVGGAQINYALWYIPTAALFFACFPVFKIVDSYPKFYWLIVPLLLLSNGLHRAHFPPVDPIRNFVYFLPVYLVGMLACRYRMQISHIVNRNLIVLLGLFLALYGLQLFYSDIDGIYASRVPFQFNKGWVDIVLFQKLIFCFLLLGLINRSTVVLTSNKLKYLANISFTLYFFHVYFLYAFEFFIGEKVAGAVFSIWFSMGLASVLCCTALAAIAQRTLGRHSRLFIGS